jgi:hypothetical protein
MEPFKSRRKVAINHGIWCSKLRVKIKIHPRVTLKRIQQRNESLTERSTVPRNSPSVPHC